MGYSVCHPHCVTKSSIFFCVVNRVLRLETRASVAVRDINLAKIVFQNIFTYLVMLRHFRSSRIRKTVSTKCRLHTADRVQYADYVQDAD